MGQDEIILNVENVTKSFGPIMAVNGVSLTVRRGSITGLIGPNGSGKSTLFNVISGTQGSFKGSVIFNRTRLNGLPPHKIFELGLGRTFQTPRLFTGMTVLENAMLGAKNQKGENPGSQYRFLINGNLGKWTWQEKLEANSTL